jgi:thiamine-phosphate pyrophosphorylase
MASRSLLYYITDRSQFRGDERVRRRALLDKIVEAASAGVDYIQLREKDLNVRDLEVLAREVVEVVRRGSSSTRLLINSRTDVALAAGADGVHLRAEDISPDEARNLRAVASSHPLSSQQFLIAVSCHTKEDVSLAESDGADFAVFAPVFGKSNASGTPPAGLDALREVCQSKVPVLALGGITVANSTSCLDAGAAGIAGIRIFQENKIADVVRVLREL